MDYSLFYGENADEKLIEKRIRDLFEQFYNAEGVYPEKIFSSPGRAEILGNHTDHNCGKVIVAAISCDILAAVKKTNDGKIKIISEGFSPVSADLSDLKFVEGEIGTSAALCKGVANALKEKNLPIGGFTAHFTSSVFKGAGVSSSASFEVLVAEIFNELYLGGKLTAVEKAVISQYAENVYFGKPCGLLDQSGIAIGGLTKLDFEVPTSPVVSPLKPFSGYSLVITNTGGDHASLTSHYAAIRKEMEEIAEYFGKKVLREVPYNAFYEHIGALKQKFSGRAILRALHFFEENERVDRAEKALAIGDLKEFLKAVNESGLSSLNKLQNCLVPGDEAQPVVLGIELSRRIIKDGAVRVHGGGFAGSILAIVNDGEVNAYMTEMGKWFGAENVFKASIRPLGTAEIK